MILRLDSPTGVVYINFSKVACWRAGYEKGSVIIFDDADHFEITVTNSPEEIAELYQGIHAPSTHETTVVYARPFGPDGNYPSDDAQWQAYYSAITRQAAIDRSTRSGEGSREDFQHRPINT